MTCGIYTITNTANGKIYVGSSKGIEGRWQEHRALLRRGRHHSPHLQRAWNLNGADQFDFSVVAEVCRDDLISAEQAWIDRTRCCEMNLGYNIAKVAKSPMLGRRHTAETRAKISAASKSGTVEMRARISKSLTGRCKPPMSLEQRRKIREALQGRKLPPQRAAAFAAVNKGRKHSQLARLNMGKAQKLRKDLVESGVRLGVSNKGRKHTQEWKKAASERMKGNTRTKGRPLSAEHRRKISEGLKAYKSAQRLSKV